MSNKENWKNILVIWYLNEEFPITSSVEKSYRIKNYQKRVEVSDNLPEFQLYLQLSSYQRQ